MKPWKGLSERNAPSADIWETLIIAETYTDKKGGGKKRENSPVKEIILTKK